MCPSLLYLVSLFCRIIVESRNNDDGERRYYEILYVIFQFSWLRHASIVTNIFYYPTNALNIQLYVS